MNVVCDRECNHENEGGSATQRVEIQLGRNAFDFFDRLGRHFARLHFGFLVGFPSASKRCDGCHFWLHRSNLYWRRRRRRDVDFLQRRKFRNFGETCTGSAGRAAFGHHGIDGDLWGSVVRLRLERFYLGLIRNRGRHVGGRLLGLHVDLRCAGECLVGKIQFLNLGRSNVRFGKRD